MDDQTSNLDRIDTHWSLIQRAHTQSEFSASEARSALVLRYSRSIREYVGVLCRNDDEADEVAQEAVVRLMWGDFAGADVSRGRFRDLLKVSVRNMVRDFWKKNNRRRGVEYDLSEIELDEATDEQDQWVEAWRNDLLDLTWEALLQHEEAHPDSLAYSVLRIRADHPGANSEKLANKLFERTGREIRPDTLRQHLRRARVRFAQLLIEEVAQGLSDSSSDSVEDELISLGLFEYLRNVLGRTPR